MAWRLFLAPEIIISHAKHLFNALKNAQSANNQHQSGAIESENHSTVKLLAKLRPAETKRRGKSEDSEIVSFWTSLLFSQSATAKRFWMNFEVTGTLRHVPVCSSTKTYKL